MKPLDNIQSEELDEDTDRRSQPRVAFQSTIDVVYQGVIVTPPPSATDISEGGLRLKGLGLPPERLVKIFVTLPLRRQGRRLLLLSGKVAWQTGPVIGVQFLNLPPESAIPLRQFISEQSDPPN